MKKHAEKERIMSKPRRILIPSFHLNNGTVITSLLLYHLHLSLECTKIHQIVQYTPKKCFSSFVQSAANARIQRDENPNSSVVAETKKLLASSSYGYEIMDRSQYNVEKYLNDGRLTVQIIINISSDLTLSLINYTRLSLSSQKLSIENQSLSDSPSCNMPSSECWSFITNSLKNFATQKSMKSLKWTPNLFIQPCGKRT